MELTTRIFMDIATLANWVFQAAICEPGAYKLSDVVRNKDGKFNIDRNALQTSSLPECATWHDESEYIVKLSYNCGMQEYKFGIDNVFDLLARFKKIATEDITAKEKNEFCILNKKEKATGELLAVVEMPKNKTRQVAKAAYRDSVLRPTLCGVYVDRSAYIVASDGNILNACKIDGTFEPDFAGAILPTEFAKRADGCTVEIYQDGEKVTAVCGGERTECIKGRYPNFRAVIGGVCEKGHVKFKCSDLKKAVGKDDAVSLLMCDGGMTVSTYDKCGDGNIPERQIKVNAEHRINEFAISVDSENIKRVMPCCNDMYVIDNTHPIYFIGSGCLSMIMPICNGNIPYCDITEGETLVSAFDIMNGVTVCNESSKKDIAAETVATVAQTETNESVKHISEIIETCRLHDEVTGEETDEYRYYKWLTIAHCGTYSNIADKALSEALAWIFVAAYRKGKGHIIAKNKYGVLIETVIATTPTEHTESVSERISTHMQNLKHVWNSGLWRRNTFRQLRERRCFAVRWIVGRTYAENAAERKETGKFTRCHGCKYRQFTRGSTLTRGMNVRTGGTNEIINKKYHGEMFCRVG